MRNKSVAAFVCAFVVPTLAAAAALPAEAPPSAKLVMVEAQGIAFASWDVSGAGGREHRVALSRDGGATWLPSEAMSYDIPLKSGLLVPGGTAPALPGAFLKTLRLVKVRAGTSETARRPTFQRGAS